MSNIDGIISQLEADKVAIERAIMALRSISPGSVGRVSREPASPSKAVAPKKRRISQEGRERIAAAARRRWAEAKKVKELNSAPVAKKAIRKRAEPAPDQAEGGS